MMKIIYVFWNLLTALFPGKRCSICMETTLFQKKHKLYCGHVFHTDCILSWFRRKKNTCPYCRCTGENNHDLDLHINNTATEVISDDWQSHEDVRIYRSNENPTKEQIINAYYIRDINMNVDIESAFNSCVRGLGINPEDYEKQIQRKFFVENDKKLKEMIKRTIENPAETIEFNYSFKFSEYLKNNIESEKYCKKLIYFLNMEEMKNENNHKGMYSLIGISDLHALGW